MGGRRTLLRGAALGDCGVRPTSVTMPDPYWGFVLDPGTRQDSDVTGTGVTLEVGSVVHHVVM